MSDVLHEQALQPRSQVLLATSLTTAQRALPVAALPTGAVAQGKKGKGAAPAAGKVADTLLFTDRENRGYALDYANFTLGMTERGARSAVHLAGDWKTLVAMLQQYRRIETLVFHYHGIPGNLIIGGEVRSLRKLAQDLKGDAPRVSNRVEFEACNVAEGVEELVPLAKLLQAPQVYAWNHYATSAPVDFEIGKNTTAAMIERELKEAGVFDYLLPGTPSPQDLADLRADTYPIPLQLRIVFYTEFPDATLPPPQPGRLAPRKRTYKPRSSADVRRVTHAAAAGLTKYYEDKPVLPLERVMLVPDPYYVPVVPGFKRPKRLPGPP